ncbi:MAG: AAA family ATPase [Xanthomonadales bacterium]|nr:AAA family ATPase [Xanthomonadales bacterium]
MSPDTLINALQDPGSYPHPCRQIRLIETHISWVLLTGDRAYKVKKPVDFGFLDFSTLDKRRHCCNEELRCNSHFAPELYIEVVPITRDQKGHIHVNGAGETVEYAVVMRQFDDRQRGDLLVERDEACHDEFRDFGTYMAERHRVAPVAALDSGWGTAAAVAKPIHENYEVLLEQDPGPIVEGHLSTLRRWGDRTHQELTDLFDRRLRQGHVRECHGDLHLSNLVRTSRGIRPFDCIEFSPALRWMDVVNDLAFLTMDCRFRKRTDLAYAFLNQYLETTGDYEGMALLDYYSVYRSLVRAKVAALQAHGPHREEFLERMRGHIDLAIATTTRHRPGLLLTCGLSGSGKSWLSRKLMRRLPAIRIRSDIERKRLAGLDLARHSGSDLDAGIYSRAHTTETYSHLLNLADGLLSSGHTVIVDATFLRRAQREPFRRLAAAREVPYAILFRPADQVTLEARIRKRQEKAAQVSEATVEVLGSQMKRFEPPTSSATLEFPVGDEKMVLSAAAQLRALLARSAGAG